MGAYLKGAWELLRFLMALLPLIREAIDTWKKMKSAAKKKKLREAVDKAVKTGDQRELEELLGSENAGKPTLSRIPELKKRPVKDRS